MSLATDSGSEGTLCTESTAFLHEARADYSGSCKRKRSDAADFDETSSVLKSLAPGPPAEFILRYGTNVDALDEPVKHWRVSERYERHRYVDKVAIQKEVSGHMRYVIIEWLVELSDEYRLGSETLFLAINLLDRYLCRAQVDKREFQLLGVTCLWVAAKYEEVRPPFVQDLADMTHNKCDVMSMRNMERRVLHELDFQLSVPTPLRFLHYFCVTAGVHCPHVFHLAECLLQVGLLDPDTMAHLPSHAAAASLLLALTSYNQRQHYPLVLSLVDCSTAVLMLELQRTKLLLAAWPSGIIISRYLDAAALATMQQQQGKRQQTAVHVGTSSMVSIEHSQATGASQESTTTISAVC